MTLKKLLFSLTFLIVPLFVFTSITLAQNVRSGEVVTLDRGEIIEDNYFAGGERVEVLGEVKGDVYAVGGTVIVDGIINGDLLVAGGNIEIRGTITHDIRAAGGNIKISGNVGGNVSVVEVMSQL
jgi:hypothetical protein